MACRLPGANTIAEFRAALRSGQDTFTELSVHELITAGLELHEYERAGYVRRAPLLNDIADFDADPTSDATSRHTRDLDDSDQSPHPMLPSRH